MLPLCEMLTHDVALQFAACFKLFYSLNSLNRLQVPCALNAGLMIIENDVKSDLSFSVRDIVPQFLQKQDKPTSY